MQRRTVLGAHLTEGRAVSEVETSRRNLALTAGALFISSSLLAALAPAFTFLSIPLWQAGFLLFLVTLALLGHLTLHGRSASGRAGVSQKT